MNKKSFLWSMFAMFVVATLSIGFTACGNDDDDGPDVNIEDIVGTWEGYNTLQGASSMDSEYGVPMTARFYDDGTCEIWWYQNPLLQTCYFTGEYTLNKNQLRLVGKYGPNGDTPSVEYDKTVECSIKDGILQFYFDLTDWILTKQE